jgi:hypothetical protein
MAAMAQTAVPRHVLQRTNNDCAIATVAMTANKKYEDIAKQSPVMIGARGLSPLEVHSLLVSHWGPLVRAPVWLASADRVFRHRTQSGGRSHPSPLEMVYAALGGCPRGMDT